MIDRVLAYMLDKMLPSLGLHMERGQQYATSSKAPSNKVMICENVVECTKGSELLKTSVSLIYGLIK